MKEIEATVVAIYMRYLFDFLKMANMVNVVGLVNPAQVSAHSRPLSQRSRHLANQLEKVDGDQIFLVPYDSSSASETASPPPPSSASRGLTASPEEGDTKSNSLP
ncbi:hypothetical protein L3X38_010744 [Prunus dulcis]|uniref:Uncharacterized protein n=1 Tax=Prunus dulcis TaxID=3755 RepID=A0AAD4WGU8_PRUDU|nr:hypothetical protein L3X38_010744 [Prunus dulcis]